MIGNHMDFKRKIDLKLEDLADVRAEKVDLVNRLKNVPIDMDERYSNLKKKVCDEIQNKVRRCDEVSIEGDRQTCSLRLRVIL